MCLQYLKSGQLHCRLGEDERVSVIKRSKGVVAVSAMSAAAGIAATALAGATAAAAQAAPAASEIGKLTTVAGIPGNPGNAVNVQATSAPTLNDVRDVAVGPDGSMYVTNLGSHTIKKIAPNGTITTFAGKSTTCEGNATSAGNYNGDNILATNAYLCNPHNATISPDGNRLVFADSGNHRVRSINLATSIITTVAGSGSIPASNADPAGDGGQATAAAFAWPANVSFTANGSMLIVDNTGERIRKVAPDGVITTLNRGRWEGPRSAVEAPNGDIYVGEQGSSQIKVISHVDGAVSVFAGVYHAYNDADSNTYYSGDGGQAANAEFKDIRDLALYGNYLYVADKANGVVRRIDLTSRVISTFAGTWGPYGAVDGTSPSYSNVNAVGARMGIMRGLDISGGWLYIAAGNHAIHRVGIDASATPLAPTPTPTPTPTVPGTPTPSPSAPGPVILTVRDGAVSVTAVKSTKLRIDVNPDLTDPKASYSLIIKVKNSKGKWVKYTTTTTKGLAAIRKLNLPRGTYKVVLPAQLGVTKATSRAIFLAR